jgi:hypothetical protein
MRVASFQIEEKVQPTVTCGMSPGPLPSSPCHSAKRQCKLVQCQPVRGHSKFSHCALAKLWGRTCRLFQRPQSHAPRVVPWPGMTSSMSYFLIFLRSQAAFLSLDICAASGIELNLV